MNKPIKPEQLELSSSTAPKDLPPKRPSPPLAFDSDRFDWDSDCVILHEQPATAIYHGGGGHIVIRQTNGHEDDVTILIAPENANTFMDGVAEFLRRE
jgi:L-ascorbate metabolism protein UlaG (beta-lactamase superfamily)